MFGTAWRKEHPTQSRFEVDAIEIRQRLRFSYMYNSSGYFIISFTIFMSTIIDLLSPYFKVCAELASAEGHKVKA